MVRFLLNNKSIECDTLDGNMTVLKFLREKQHLTGTKEGCSAGDCGACTVVTAELNHDDSALYYRTINSCIALMSSLHGKQLITVEHLSQAEKLHVVQQAYVDNHASQCGFCTPGFVMSSFALYHNADNVEREDVVHALSGNLCRCTGYRPIIDATLSACRDKQPDIFDSNEKDIIEKLKALRISPAEPTPRSGLLMPTTRESLAAMRKQFPDAPLVAGGTDLSLEITQKLTTYPVLISLSQMTGLKGIHLDGNTLEIGAALSLSDIMPELIRHFPALQEIMERFASLPIRNQATLGGNVANASPIGDTPPILLALNARIVIDNGVKQRSIAASEFFLDYRQTALNTDEWISSVHIPIDNSGILGAYKISKRMEDDISAVCAIFNLSLDENKITAIKTGFGGVAATPVACDALEKALIGLDWRSSDCLSKGKTILFDAFSPIDDVRASATYRKTMLANLWHRFWLENQPSNHIATRVIQHA